MSAELKACPFCGSHGIDRELTRLRPYPYCTNCGANGPITKATWNTRADLLPPPAADYVADLVGEARFMLDTGAVQFSETVSFEPATITAILAKLDEARPASPDTRVVTPQEAAQVLLSVGEMPLNAKLAAVHEYANRDKGGCRPVALTEAWKAALRAIIDGGQDRG